MGHGKFHFSVDDVLSSLIEVSDNDMRLEEHPFFKDIWKLHKKYGLQTGLYVFDNVMLRGKKRYLSEVVKLQSQLKQGWLFFGAHALNYETAPYAQHVEDNVKMLESIYANLDRIAGENICRRIRLHYHSECFELRKTLEKFGVTEMLTTDKPVGLHRFDATLQTKILQEGVVNFEGINLRRSHIRVENMANDEMAKDEFLDIVRRIETMHGTFVLYSHEYEHLRDDVRQYFDKAICWLCEDLNMVSERP